MNTNESYHCTDKGVYYHVNGKFRKFTPYSDKIRTISNHKKIANPDVQLTFRQRAILRECLHGLKQFTEFERSKMSEERKKEILERYNKSQEVINLQKWESSRASSDSFLSALIAKSKGSYKSVLSWLRDSVCTIEEEDNVYKNNSPLNVIGKTKDIVDLLLKNNILPQNFYQIN